MPPLPRPHFIAFAWLMTWPWLIPLTSQASIVNRCEAPDGTLTFTDLSCAEKDSLSLQEAYNPPPGNNHSLLPRQARNPSSPVPRSPPGASFVVVEQLSQPSAFRAGTTKADKQRKPQKREKTKRYNNQE